ncbi:hypothetical protein ABZX30_21145 [Streptomyces sp. NPDC004542]|uniref:hypothetical protein n=1 Tax=Streptomyces sp. NPDC004542 TaxID=3154281 RepID=UPI0033A1AE9F
MSDRAERGDSHERHEPYEWHEPTEQHEQEHTSTHAGNGTVNHGPADRSPDGLDSDELDLRRLLHSAVDDIEPSDGTLDHLRRAVPARRARKRQAVVGMAAAALFIGTAIPALVHVSHSAGSDPNTSMAGQASQAQGGGSGKNPDGGAGTAGGAGGKTGGKDEEGTKPPGKNTGTGNAGGSTGGANPSASVGAGTPACTAAQLGSATGTVDAPDSTGVVYGTFRVVNTSTTSCTVGGPGSVGAAAQGAADPARIGTARHVSGDAAAGLPDPSLEVSGLVLLPGAAYEEKFAFVPSATCPATGGGGTDPGGTDPGGATPTPTPTQEAGTAGGTDTSGATTSGVTTQLFAADGTADGSVVVSHTTQAGSPTASVTVPDACAGTVYWTGVLSGA